MGAATSNGRSAWPLPGFIEARRDVGQARSCAGDRRRAGWPTFMWPSRNCDDSKPRRATNSPSVLAVSVRDAVRRQARPSIPAQPGAPTTPRMRRPGFTEGSGFDSGSVAGILLWVVVGLELGRRDIANGRQEPVTVSLHGGAVAASGTAKIMPSEVVTDRAPSYLVVWEELLPTAWHRTDSDATNRIQELALLVGTVTRCDLLRRIPRQAAPDAATSQRLRPTPP